MLDAPYRFFANPSFPEKNVLQFPPLVEFQTLLQCLSCQVQLVVEAGMLHEEVAVDGLGLP